MIYLILFENFEKRNIIRDAFYPLEDIGFVKYIDGYESEEVDYVQIIYKRDNSKNLGMDLHGIFEFGEILWGHESKKSIEFYKLYDNKKLELVEEIENSLSIISGILNKSISFSITNYYKEDKIIIRFKS